jgi:hypothetical protein
MGGIGDKKACIREVTCKINTISHEGGTILSTGIKDGMTEVIKCVKSNSERLGLNLNLQKITVMSAVEKVNIFQMVMISAQ